jgi:Domain of unknown function (DUF1906)
VLAGLAAASQLCMVAFAAGPASTLSVNGINAGQQDASSCSTTTSLGSALRNTCNNVAAVSADPIQLKLPAGTRQCPDSGPQVTCHVSETSAPPASGVASIPSGTTRCAVVADKQGPITPASCNDTVLTSPDLSAPGGRFGTTVPLPVPPSVPASSLSAMGPQQTVDLTANVGSVQPGQGVLLTATSRTTMTGTPYAIEIFDQTTSTLVGACMQASQCLVSYAATSGIHAFAAFITPPTAKQPISNTIASSKPVNVAWLGLTLATSTASIVGPGKSITFTATATADFGRAGYVLGLYDRSSGSRLTYCSQGSTCSTTLTKLGSGRHSIVAYLGGSSLFLPPPAIQAQSAPITATWLGVSLAANTIYPHGGSVVYMKATANADLTNTPWSIGIFDAAGNLVSNSCKSGASCTARVQLTAGPLPWFTAVIGAPQPMVDGSTASIQLVRTAQTHSALVNIQARSAAVQPTRLLWGVDSCKPITTSASGSNGLYAQVSRNYGPPDFWGRYMTNTYNCPGLNTTEIAAAAFRNFGILPIYNDYDCNAVRGYKVGLRYAAEATAAATRLGIPQGRVLAIDIEPYGEQCPGAANVDAGFIEGWYDGVMSASYIPLFYGNGTVGSEFGNAWCTAINQRPEVAVDSFLWTFQPSLIGRWTKAKAPAFTPNQPGCTGNFDVWQYVLSTGAKPDVDSDEALSTVPLWYPGAATTS